MNNKILLILFLAVIVIASGCVSKEDPTQTINKDPAVNPATNEETTSGGNNEYSGYYGEDPENTETIPSSTESPILSTAKKINPEVSVLNKWNEKLPRDAVTIKDVTVEPADENNVMIKGYIRSGTTQKSVMVRFFDEKLKKGSLSAYAMTIAPDKRGEFMYFEIHGIGPMPKEPIKLVVNFDTEN